MDKLLKILFAAVSVFVLFLFLGQFINSCNKPESIIGNVPPPSEQNTIDPSQSDTKLPEDSFFEEADTVDYFADDTTSVIDYDEIDNISNQEIKPKSQTQVAPQKENTSQPIKPQPKPIVVEKVAVTKEVKKPIESNPVKTISKGSYAVHAGSFIIEANADKLVKELKALGFSNAVKVVYDNSATFTVVAGQANNDADAQAIAQKLKAKGKDSFVVKRK